MPDNIESVTCIIPCHNGARYIRDTLLSLDRQTRRPVRIIVINDGSTDETVSVLEAAGQTMSFEVMKNSSNLGRAASVNAVLDRLDTEFVALLDADDISEPTRIERQVAIMHLHPTLGGCASYVNYINSDGKRIGRGTADLKDDDILTKYLQGDEPFGLYCSSVLFRSSVFADTSLRFRSKFWPADDQDLWNRIAEKGWMIRVIPEYLVSYRIHGKSAVTSDYFATRLRYEYVRTCLRARRKAAGEPTWDQFYKEYQNWPIGRRLNWRRKTMAKALFRDAGFARAQQKWPTCFAKLLCSLILQPTYSFPRVWEKWKLNA